MFMWARLRLTLGITALLDLRCGPFGNRFFLRQGVRRGRQRIEPERELRLHCTATIFSPLSVMVLPKGGGKFFATHHLSMKSRSEYGPGACHFPRQPRVRNRSIGHRRRLLRQMTIVDVSGGGGAWGRIRTTDTRIFNPLLYQLSYPGRQFGSAVYRRPQAPCPEARCLRLKVSPGLPEACRIVAVLVVSGRRDRIAPHQPALQIDVGAPPRTERAIVDSCGFRTDRALRQHPRVSSPPPGHARGRLPHES